MPSSTKRKRPSNSDEAYANMPTKKRAELHSPGAAGEYLLSQQIPQAVSNCNKHRVNRGSTATAEKHRNRATTVTFGILSAETIKDGSVCAIDTPRTHLRGHPLENGLLDSRMGPSKAGDMCVTCNREYSQCPGHHGHLSLELPVFNAEFIMVVLKILRSVCFHCSRLLLRNKHFEAKIATLRQITNKKERLSAIAAATKSILYCGDTAVDKPNLRGLPCGGPQVRYTYVKRDCTITVQPSLPNPATPAVASKGRSTHTKSYASSCTPLKLHSILRHIPAQDVEFLGFSTQYSHPRDMMWTVLYIPPPLIRPARGDRTRHVHARSENDLTKRLKSIVRYNQLLGKELRQVEDAPALTNQGTSTRLGLPTRESSGAQDRKWGKSRSRVPSLMTNTDCASASSSTSASDQASRAYRELQLAVGSYQNNTAVLKGGSQYGKMPDSIRNRFQGAGGAKKYRVRGTLLSVRTNEAARGVIVPSDFASPCTIGVPKWMCMRMTYPERVTPFNRARLLLAASRGPDQYPGAQYAISPFGTMYDLRAKQAPPIDDGWVVRRHLVSGDHVLVNRQPSLHKQSILGLKIAVTDTGDALHVPPVLCKSFAADFDGDEMNLLPCQSEEASAECEVLAGVAENMLKDGKAIVAFMQHSALFYYKVTIREGTASPIRRSHVHMSLHHFIATASADPYHTGVNLLDTVKVRESLHKPRMDGFEFISLFLPPDLTVHSGGMDIVGGYIQSKQVPITMKMLNDSILLTMCRDYGNAAALRYLGGMCQVANYMMNLIGCSISYDDCAPSEEDMRGPRESTTAFLAQVEATLRDLDGDLRPSVETSVIDCVDAARESLAQAAVASMRAKALPGDNGLLDIIDSQTKGSPANLSSICAVLGQQLTISHERQDLGLDDLDEYGVSLKRLGYIDRSFVTGLTPIQYYHHLAAARSSVVNMSIQTASTGYIARKLSIFMQDMTVTASGHVQSEGGHIVQFLFGDDGFSTDGEPVAISFVGMDVRCTFKHFWYVGTEDITSVDNPTAQRTMKAAEAELGRILRLQQIFRERRIRPVYTSPVNFARLLSRAAFHRSPYTAVRPLNPLRAEELIRGAWEKVAQLTHGRPCLLLSASFWDNWTLRNLCTVLALDEAAVSWAINTMCNMLHRGTVVAGSPVGIIAAQYATEPMTQANLSSTHSAGQGPTSSGGISSTVSRLISFSSSNGADHVTRLTLRPGESAAKFAASIVRYTVRDFVLGADEMPESNSTAEGGRRVHLYKSPVLVSLTLDRRRMLQADILPAELFRELQTAVQNSPLPAAHVELLPDSMIREQDEQWVMRLRYVSHDSWDLDEDQGDPGNCDAVYPTLAQLTFGGMAGIRSCSVRGESDVYIQGNNLLGLLCDPRVLTRSIRSSDISSTFQILGIDAAVAAICTEWICVLKDVSYKHLRLIADAMCYKGLPVPVSTRGLVGAPVMKIASFEKSVDNIVTGALFGCGDSHTTSTATYCGAMCWNGILTGVGTGRVCIVDEPSSLPLRMSSLEPTCTDAGYRGHTYAEASLEGEVDFFANVRTQMSRVQPRTRGRLSNGIGTFTPWTPPPTVLVPVS